MNNALTSEALSCSSSNLLSSANNNAGGLVDTGRNSVTAEISSLAPYAVLTTKPPVGVEDEPENDLPYRFELSQNWQVGFYRYLSLPFVAGDVVPKKKMLVLKEPGTCQFSYKGRSIRLPSLFVQNSVNPVRLYPRT